MTRPEDEPTLAEQTARRLILAGIKPGNPALTAIREWNATVQARQAKEDPNA